MKIQLLLMSMIFAYKGFAQETSCVPAHEYFPFEGKWVSKNDSGDTELGMYSRISPDGRYILRSFSGRKVSQVTLMELVRGEKNSVKLYETPMKNEAFPVQGSWRYLVDVGGQHYKLTDIKQFQKKAKEQFKGGISGFYTVAAELPGGTTKSHKIRSLSWPTDNADNQGVGVLSNKIITVSINEKGNAEKTDSSSTNYMCSNLRSSDGQIMSLPMISPDGQEFSSMPQNPKDSEPSMRIYRIDEDQKSCTKVQDLKVVAAKLIFSGKETNAVLFYAGSSLSNRGNGIHFYDRDVKKTFTLDDPQKKVHADSFPGYTHDGRIVYAAHWEDCSTGVCKSQSGYVVSDPHQSEDVINFGKENPASAGKFKKCITSEEVKSIETSQEAIWSYGL